MKSITFDHGIVSQYDDFDIWVQDYNEGSNAVIITKTENPKISKIQYGIVVKVIDKSNFKTDDDYDTVCAKMMNEYDITAEFITDNSTTYIGIKTTDLEFEVEDIKFNNVYYC